jgi:hypothetical protein
MPVVLNSGSSWALLGVVSSAKTGRLYFGHMLPYSKIRVSFFKMSSCSLSAEDQNTTILLNGGTPAWKCARPVIWLNFIPMFNTSVKKFLCITNCLKKEWQHDLVGSCYFTDTFYKHPSAVKNRYWLNGWRQ